MRDGAQSLVERYRTLAPDGLRLVIWYEGDEHAVVHARDGVVEMDSPAESEGKVKRRETRRLEARRASTMPSSADAEASSCGYQER